MMDILNWLQWVVRRVLPTAGRPECEDCRVERLARDRVIVPVAKPEG